VMALVRAHVRDEHIEAARSSLNGLKKKAA
jgi:hypothetical protein